MKLAKIILVFLLTASIIYFSVNYKYLHQESKLGFVDYCKYYNYPVQSHYVTTEDGYIIKMYRIQKKNTNFTSNKPVVLFVHGFLDLSDTFIINDEDKAPGFILANLGYDVWFGNNRGNTHSKNHTKLNPKKDNKYWDFSFQEMAQFDLPAMFQNIIQYAPNQKINFIGHSQGSLQMFIALSERSKVVVDNLGKFISLGPAVYLEHTQIFQTFTNMIHLYHSLVIGQEVEDEIMPIYGLYTFGARLVCGYFPTACKYAVGSTSTNDYEADNYERYDIVACKQPAGSSMRNALHYQQLISNHTLQKYDFGKEENLRRYGNSIPPMWNLANIKEKIYLFTAKDDAIVRPEDVNRLKSELVNAEKVFHKEIDGGHLTFMYGKSVSYLQYVIEILQQP